MRQSTRSARAARKAIGGGGSGDLPFALPAGAGRVPHAHRLSKRANRRLKWLDYRKAPTVTRTCRRYDLPRSTLRRWQKRFDPGNLASLEDRSSRPRTVRQRAWGVPGVNAVLALRAQYPRRGQAKLAALLARQGMPPSVSMIGRILRYVRQRRLRVAPQRMYATPRARHARPHARRKPNGVTIAKGRPGDLVEIDTMRLFPSPGVARSHFSAVDVASRYGSVGIRGVATAGTAKGSRTEVRARSPFAIEAIRIAGGGECMAAFEAECHAQKIPLCLLPPHSPKLHGHVERINRTLREGWWECYAGEADPPSMQQAGRDGEAVDNTIRPHQSPGMRTPVECLAEQFGIHP